MGWIQYVTLKRGNRMKIEPQRQGLYGPSEIDADDDGEYVFYADVKEAVDFYNKHHKEPESHRIQGKHDLKSALSDLEEIRQMIVYKSDSDKYIKSMEQYIANPWAYLMTESIKAIEDKHHKEPCSKCKWEATAIGVGSDSPCDGCRTDNFEPKVKKK